MDLTIIGARLVSLRKSKSVSQLEFSEKTGLDRTYPSRIKEGKQNLTVDTLITIYKGLNDKIYHK